MHLKTGPKFRHPTDENHHYDDLMTSYKRATRKDNDEGVKEAVRESTSHDNIVNHDADMYAGAKRSDEVETTKSYDNDATESDEDTGKL